MIIMFLSRIQLNTFSHQLLNLFEMNNENDHFETLYSTTHELQSYIITPHSLLRFDHPLLIHLCSSCFFYHNAKFHQNYMYSAKLLILKTPENYYGSSFKLWITLNMIPCLIVLVQSMY